MLGEDESRTRGDSGDIYGVVTIVADTRSGSEWIGRLYESIIQIVGITRSISSWICLRYEIVVGVIDIGGDDIFAWVSWNKEDAFF